mmetsp:Transcript_48647/g.72643  ORF Transcript_48647/g.72643 Transcript_48647/m.72643 type:complete len:249 (-) Transcript_48647:876-1622(-)|eukprot:CAMPEP_0194041402 /NCGR_PEP_ID=MMETSP0009_2-20130614/13319_1 /TAXON_ID=210454 /ORGANISM="Grammatophora oceanica, Strain CCMP 410" /LENGTH=248 /DNA_ID=CAMNT_0038684905 /DNA_START=314 /DNA_END=1060 /DNA_ORIENTATION=-
MGILIKGHQGKPKITTTLVEHGQEQKGSKLFDESIARNLRKYNQDGDLNRRSLLIAKVVSKLLAQGYRFLKYDASDGLFLALGEEDIRTEVATAFQHQSKKVTIGSEDAEKTKRPEARRDESEEAVGQESRSWTTKNDHQDNILFHDDLVGTTPVVSPTTQRQQRGMSSLQMIENVVSLPDTALSAGGLPRLPHVDVVFGQGGLAGKQANVAVSDDEALFGEDLTIMSRSHLIENIACELIARVEGET